MTKSIIDIMKETEGADTIGISGHMNPDGDCIGASLAVYLYLKKRRPNASIIVMMEEPGDKFHYLKGVSEFVEKTDKETHRLWVNEETSPEENRSEFTELERQLLCGERNFDVFFAMDTNLERLGAAQPFYEKAVKKINIDHHISNAVGSGDCNYIDPEASATSELVYALIEKQYMDCEIAEAIYLGITHDTGVFAYPNTKPETLRIAADLIEYGFDFAELLSKTFYEKSFLQNQVFGYALSHCYLRCEGKLNVCVMTKKELDELGATGKDIDGIVAHMRQTEGVECSLFLRQIGNEYFKGSLRSKGNADVAVISSLLGGGGHVRAAGFTTHGNPNDIVSKIVKVINEQLGIASDEIEE